MPSPRVPSARVLQNRANRVVMNRAALDAAQLGIADGMAEIGARIIAAARANELASEKRPVAERDVPPLAEMGRFSVFALGKLVAGDTSKTASQNKPRGVKTPKGEVVLVTYFGGKTAHFKELGTINEIARPFLTPAFNANIGGADQIVGPAMGKRIAAVPG